MESETILDVGSRLGPVLYGAYIYTSSPNIIGVEINSEFLFFRFFLQKLEIINSFTVILLISSSSIIISFASIVEDCKLPEKKTRFIKHIQEF